MCAHTRLIRMSLVLVLILRLIQGASSPTGRRNSVPKHLKKLYKALVIRRKYSPTRQVLQPPDVHWANASLFIYFNLANFGDDTDIRKGDLLLYRRRSSFMGTIVYQQYFRIMLKDVNTGNIFYNRTISTSKSFCRINFIKLIKRWKTLPHTNKGLVVTVRDTGRFSAETLRTFYPRRNLYVPALALYLKKGNFLARYIMIPSQIVRIVVNGTLG